MGVDCRGKERAECGECDCEEYEAPVRGAKCAYCDCAPPKHRLTSSNNNNNNSGSNNNNNSGSNNIHRNNSYPTDRAAFNDLPAAGTFAHEPADDWAHVESITTSPLSSKPASKPFIANQQDEKDVPEIVAATKKTEEALPPSSSAGSPGSSKQRARDLARQPAPSRRKKEESKSPSPRPTAGKNAGGKKRKSVAVKCHNLEDVMSSHLSDHRTAERIDQMFSSYDDDGSNELDRQECTALTGYILEQCGLQADIIPSFVYDEAFSKYDEDGGGTITLDEFREFLMSHLKK